MNAQRDHSKSHRVVVEFDGGAYAVRLIHPEQGCVTADLCGLCGRSFDDTETEPCYDCKPPIPQSNQDCWVQGWFDNEGVELLNGKVELVVEEEYDMDHCTLHVTDAAMPAKEESR